MTRQIRVGGVPIGGGAPVTIQSMTNTRTDDVSATAEQIKRLAAAGCEIVRVAVPDLAAARAVGAIRERSPIPFWRQASATAFTRSSPPMLPGLMRTLSHPSATHSRASR